MIEVKNVSKSFRRKEVFHSVNLRLDTKVYGVLGANGVGKTTLIRCIAGLYEPEQGEILYNNEPIHKSQSFSITTLVTCLKPLACSRSSLYMK